MTTLTERLNKFLATNFDDVATEEEAHAAIKELKALHEAVAGSIEDDLAALAVKFKIDVYLGDYGNGRHVCLEPDEWHDYAVGEWVPSSATC